MEKTFTLDHLVRDNIRRLEPYSSARGDYQSGTLMDANENAFGSPLNDQQSLHRYPSPYQHTLRKAIGELRSVRAQNVFAGSGSDEAIDLLFRIFCEPGTDRVIVTPPTYGMYAVNAAIHNVAVDRVNLTENFSLDVDHILESVTDHTKLLFLCSPNNPTGNDLDPDAIKTLINEFDGIVILDEAYIDFSKAESFASLVTGHPNLVVLQTLSKAFGLAGIRLGVALAPEPVINYLNKVKAPYNINRLTQQAALEGLQHTDTVRFRVEKIIEERNRLSKALSMLNVVKTVYPSSANFLLFRVNNAREIHRKLADRSLIVRYRGDQPGCGNCLRVTVGTPEENDTFISTLKQVAT